MTCARDQLTQLPAELLANVARRLDAAGLCALGDACGALRRAGEGLAREWLAARHSPWDAGWTWRQRLRAEASLAAFDRAHAEAKGFEWDEGGLSLPLLGPRLLVSAASTRDRPRLAWRFRVLGNLAVEFGVLPDDPARLADDQALHQCREAAGEAPAAVGFSSTMTLHSQLPVAAAVLHGSVVEVAAARGVLRAWITHPADAQETYWARDSSRPKRKPYRGPRRLALQLHYDAAHDVRLAMTAWAKAKFDFFKPMM